MQSQNRTQFFEILKLNQEQFPKKTDFKPSSLLQVHVLTIKPQNYKWNVAFYCLSNGFKLE